jgi:hypothetical protein
MDIVKEVVEVSVKTWSVVLGICGIVITTTFVVRAAIPAETAEVVNDENIYNDATAGARRQLGGGGNETSAAAAALKAGFSHNTQGQALASVLVLGSTAWFLFFGQFLLLLFVLSKKGQLIDEDVKRVLGVTELPPRKSAAMGKMLPDYLVKLGAQATEQAAKLADEANAQSRSIGISRKLATAFVRNKFAKQGIHADTDGFKSVHGEVCSHHTIEQIEFFNQAISLLNCFYMGFYLVYVRTNVVTADIGILPNFVVHALLILPCLLLAFWFSPLTAKELALFMGVLHEDKELVAEVFHLMEEVIEIRDVLKAGLIDLAKAWSEEEPDFNMDFTQGPVEIAKQAATATFERMDLDQGGSLSYKEFRTVRELPLSCSHPSMLWYNLWLKSVPLSQGLETYKIHLHKRKYKKLMRVIDPDQSGELSLQEWVQIGQ